MNEPMNKIFTVLSSVIFSLSILFTGCSTVPMDTKKPIEIDMGYRQDGKMLDRSQMKTTLKENADARPKVEKAETFEVYSLVTGLPGSVMFGYALGTEIAGKNANWTVGGIGAVLWTAGIVLGYISEESLKDAARIHNSSLNKTPAKRTLLDSVSPYLGSSRGADPVLGLSLAI